MSDKTNYVFFGDSPTLDTGFACVTRNIISRLPFQDQIHFWGLGYNNIPHDYTCKLYPGNIDSAWESDYNIERFYDFLNHFKTPITLWVLHDSFRLKVLAPVIDKIREKNTLKLITYTPVDSYTTPEDTDLLSRADIPVAYNMFGAYELKKHTTQPIHIIPHGIEHNYYNLDYNRHEIRQSLFPQLNDDNFIITNVNSNSVRKDPFSTLAIFNELRKLDSKYKLYMHMNPNPKIGLDIKTRANELGLLQHTIFADPFFGDKFSSYNCSKDMLAKIYSASDLVISTSHGEGWGLTITEAAACGTTVAIPKHTSYQELFSDDTCIFLPVKNCVFHENKYWPYVDVIKAAQTIHATTTEELNIRATKAQQQMLNYNWDNIVQSWVKLFEI